MQADLPSSTDVDRKGAVAREPIDEPLSLSAPLAARLASELCAKHPSSHRDCAWYHGAWQYFRLLDLVATPQDHTSFFLQALTTLARGDRHRRILICGSADYSMLAHVARAYRGASTPPAITVVDICETPLFLNRWYAARLDMSVQTHRSDILEYGAATPFDVICTHSFLGNFPPACRQELIATWSKLLRPGGKLLTINRIRSSVEEPSIGFTGEQARTFEHKVLRAAERHRQSLPMEPEQLRELARVYAEQKRTYPVRSSDELAELLVSNELELDCFQSEAPCDSIDDRDAGPGVRARPGEYLRIIASRA